MIWDTTQIDDFLEGQPDVDDYRVLREVPYRRGGGLVFECKS